MEQRQHSTLTFLVLYCISFSAEMIAFDCAYVQKVECFIDIC